MISDFIILLIIFVILHYFYFLVRIYRGIGNLESYRENNHAARAVSLIIPFRNESENILASLISIENQDYPKHLLEVIYVNDNSADDSLEKLLSANKSANIKVISVEKENGEKAFKKTAVTLGIESSHGDIIVTTDADCTHNKEWISILVSYFDGNTGLVSGPVTFSESPKFWDKIQSLEFQGLITAGAGLIGIKKPVICSAANLAYTRKAFEEVDGFADQLHLTSGDDELLMQKIWMTGKYDIKFCPEHNVIVRTAANKSVEEFYNQRKRWASKGLFYTDKLLIVKLILIFIYYVSLPALFVLSFFDQVYFVLLITSLLGKFVLEYLVMSRGDELIFKSGLLKYLLLAELMQIPYIIIAGISGVFGNFKWKGRSVTR